MHFWYFSTENQRAVLNAFLLRNRLKEFLCDRFSAVSSHCASPRLASLHTRRRLSFSPGQQRIRCGLGILSRSQLFPLPPRCTAPAQRVYEFRAVFRFVDAHREPTMEQDRVIPDGNEPRNEICHAGRFDDRPTIGNERSEPLGVHHSRNSRVSRSLTKHQSLEDYDFWKTRNAPISPETSASI